LIAGLGVLVEISGQVMGCLTVVGGKNWIELGWWIDQITDKHDLRQNFLPKPIA
jgi:hypothetical protein